jgi:hydrophobic/amphiphilic exporter-1 (mainly G- bacteria), HAE1 family
VAQVLVFGPQKYAVRLYLNPNALVQRNLALDQVVEAIQRANSNRPSGLMEGAERAYAVKADAELKKAADFRDVIVAFRLARESLPAGISTTLAGSAKTFEESMRDLPILLVITILVIYMILAILYEHLGHPLTILTALPLAGFGALIMLLTFHQEINIFSFVGIILLVGLVKKNGIMMVDFALGLQREKGLPAEQAIVEASLVRFRPIMMTTLAAILATLPIALGYGIGGEARQPLGVAVVGGLLFSQLLTLYLTPTFYVSLKRFTQWLRRGPARYAQRA